MMPQLLAHLLGDYVLQSTWKALNKSKVTWICMIHCVTYTMCFIPLTSSLRALAVICATHFLIDRFGLARYVIWIKEWQSPYPILPFSWCSMTGYFDPEAASEAIQKVEDPIKAMVLEERLAVVSATELNRPIWLRVWLCIITDNFFHLLCNYAALTYLK